jgi:hypothetical protein
MKQLYFILLAGILYCTYSCSQNLALNPSLETLVSTAPCSWLTTDLSGYVANWKSPTTATPDVFSTTVAGTCWASATGSGSAYGPQLPRTGNIMGSGTFYRVASSGCSPNPWYEYLEGTLSTPLTVGQTYYAEFYISAADQAQYHCNGQGMYFSTTLVNTGTCNYLVAPTYTPLFSSSAVITDKVNWVQVSGTFTAVAPYQYFIIGNFLNTASTTVVNNPTGGTNGNAYYFIDDVLVTPITPLPISMVSLYGKSDMGTHLLRCNISNYENFKECYLDQASPKTPDEFKTIYSIQNPTAELFHIAHNLTQNGDYLYRIRLLDKDGKMYLSNTINLAHKIEEGIKIISAYPNPAYSHQMIIVPFYLSNPDERITCTVMDISGRVLSEYEITEADKIRGSIQLTNGLSSGTYLIKLSNGRENAFSKISVL